MTFELFQFYVWGVSAMGAIWLNNIRPRGVHNYIIKLMTGKWKGNPSGSKACMVKQQSRFYWSCSSVEMKDVTPLTPLAHERNSIFKCKQHTIHDPWDDQLGLLLIVTPIYFAFSVNLRVVSWSVYGKRYKEKINTQNSKKTSRTPRLNIHSE